MIYGTQLSKSQFDATQSLFGLPFLARTIVLVSIILFCFFGKWLITIHNGEGTVFFGIGKIGWTRTFSYTRDNDRFFDAVVGIGKLGSPAKSSMIQTGGRKFQFGATIPETVQQYIAAVLNKECRRI
jgi:hypothetical protein